MKLETILGAIIGAALIIGAIFYVVNSKKAVVESDVTSLNGAFLTAEEKKTKYPPAPDISTPDGFVNTEGKPITISEFKGKKVVLLDIWTYSCINCQRTLPYLNAWYEKYKDQGLVIIGLHTPEFSFEKIQKNVEDAVAKYNIKYPVVLDNDFSTWNAYGNQYWPRKYLIDIDGLLVYDHTGEGGYEQTERAIQHALAERAERLGIKETMTEDIAKPTDVINFNPGAVGSPETYFGAARNEYFGNGKKGSIGMQTLIIPKTIDSNSLYLGGSWNITGEYAENKGDGTIVFKYQAKNVYMVASSDAGADVEVWKDGALLKTIKIKEEELYTLIEDADYGVHTLEIRIKKPVKAFTFTFG